MERSVSFFCFVVASAILAPPGNAVATNRPCLPLSSADAKYVKIAIMQADAEVMLMVVTGTYCQ
jgi:hypothetical protein